jgi:chromosome segregation ATPase
LKERLANMAPDNLNQAIMNNAKLSAQVMSDKRELKNQKKLLLQQDAALADALAKLAAGGGRGDGKDSKELERMWREEKERRKTADVERKRLEAAIRQLEDELDTKGGGNTSEDLENLRAQLEDTEASEAVYRDRAESLEEELENARAQLEDQAEEIDKFRDAADRAQEELETMQANKTQGLGDSVGMGKGRETRLLQKVQEMEQVSQFVNLVDFRITLRYWPSLRRYERGQKRGKGRGRITRTKWRSSSVRLSSLLYSKDVPRLWRRKPICLKM